MAQHELILSCLQDTFTDINYRDSNYYQSATLMAGERGTWGQDGVGQRYQTFLKFNSSALPLRKKVISVKVFVYVEAATAVGYIAAAPINYTNIQNLDTITPGSLGGYVFGILSHPISELYTGSLGWISFDFIDSAAREIANGAVVQIGQNPSLLISEQSGKQWTFSSKEATNKPYLKVTYEDSPPLQPIALEPSGSYIANNYSIRFSWQYLSELGGIQKGFAIQWRLVGSSTWNTINQTTSNNYYDVPANTFPNGSIEWQVITSNEYNETSVFSEIKSFYAIGSPATPIVTVETSARPIINWSATNQRVFDIILMKDEITVHSALYQAGMNVFTYKIPTYLDDGAYKAKIRVKNEYDFWSLFGECNFLVSTTKPAKPSLTIVPKVAGVRLNLTCATSKRVIYRKSEFETDFKPIATITATFYEDFSIASNTEYSYKIRAVNSVSSFNDSDAVTYKAVFDRSYISDVLNLSNVEWLKYKLDSKPITQIQNSTGKTLFEFIGREFPVTELSGFKSMSVSLSYFVSSVDYNNVIKIINSNTILYRDKLGEKMYCTVTGQINSKYIKNERINGYEISFVLGKVDFAEEVDI